MQNWHKKANDFYNEVRSQYRFSKDENQVLDALTDALSNYWKASDIISENGLVVAEPGKMPRKNPACEVSKNMWAQFLAGCRHLGICVPESQPKRSYTKGGAI